MVGYSVTGRVKSVKQPWGGYIRPKQFSVTTIGEGQEGLSPYESVHTKLYKGRKQTTKRGLLTTNKG